MRVMERDSTKCCVAVDDVLVSGSIQNMYMMYVYFISVSPLRALRHAEDVYNRIDR